MSDSANPAKATSSGLPSEFRLTNQYNKWTMNYRPIFVQSSIHTPWRNVETLRAVFLCESKLSCVLVCLPA